MNLRMVAVAFSLLVASACGGPVALEEQEVSPSHGPADVPEENTDKTALWYSCSEWNGKGCQAPGLTSTCYHQYPNQPGTCTCTRYNGGYGGYVLVCG
jgi:hypothetical protein